MIWNMFSVIFITYYPKKHELFLKFIFHGFDAHLKDYVSARIRFRPGIHQPLRGFFGVIFPTTRLFEPTILVLNKAARCHPFLAVVRCLFHNLRLKRSSLINVYLNFKFEISLLTSHLFFSLFHLDWFRN